MDEYANPKLIVPENPLKVLNDENGTCATFEIAEEDHTLGNALRYALVKSKNVEFCGYNIPHPSEAKLNLRVQTCEHTTAMEEVRNALVLLEEICEHIDEQYLDAVARFTPSMDMD